MKDPDTTELMPTDPAIVSKRPDDSSSMHVEEIHSGTSVLNRQIRVCHMTCGHNAYDARIFRKECRSLARAGYKVICIGVTEGDTQVDGIRVLGIPEPRRLLGRVTLDLLTVTTWRILRRALYVRPDIFHFHDPYLIPAGLFLKALGKRVIYDVHEWEEARFSGGVRNRWMRKSLAFAIWRTQLFCARFFDGIVGATPHITSPFERAGLRATTVNNFPLVEEIVALGQPSLVPKDGRTLCYVGFITEARGATQMIEALTGTSARLVLVGTFCSSELLARCQRLPGWSQVDYRGQVSREEVIRILKTVDVGLVLLQPHPNYLDSHPTKLFEYMAAGIPVVVSDFPYFRGLVEGAGICADPTDVSAIRSAICQMLDLSEPDRERMGRFGADAVLTRFSWATEEDQLLGIYKDILQSNGRVEV